MIKEKEYYEVLPIEDIPQGEIAAIANGEAWIAQHGNTHPIGVAEEPLVKGIKGNLCIYGNVAPLEAAMARLLGNPSRDSGGKDAEG